MLHQAPLERLPLETASLDGAITLNTIYFVPDASAKAEVGKRGRRRDVQCAHGGGDRGLVGAVEDAADDAAGQSVRMPQLRREPAAPAVAKVHVPKARA
jgi:hypothetical protein